jgi:hypothetical protein
LLEEGSADLAGVTKSDEVAIESAAGCEVEATVRVLLLKTASRFIK